jgi:transcriptional regulator with XRE-family HTH domain
MVNGDEIRRLRKENDWSMAAVARRAKIEVHTVASAEKSRDVKVSTLVKLARVLNVHPGELISVGE